MFSSEEIDKAALELVANHKPPIEELQAVNNSVAFNGFAHGAYMRISTANILSPELIQSAVRNVFYAGLKIGASIRMGQEETVASSLGIHRVK